MSISKRRRAADLCSSSSEEEEGPSQPGGQRQGKRQALISCVLTAIKEDIKHEIRAVVGETVRQVIKEELGHLIAQPSRSIERAPSRCVKRGDRGNLQLHIETRLSFPVYTWQHIEGEKGAPIRIALIDMNTGNVVAPEHFIKLDIVVLEGDFGKDKSNDWTREEFEDYRVREREGRAALLVGDLHVMLEGGVGEIGKLKFTDNSSWNRSQKFRIGLRVASGYCEGVRIREAITEAIRVKEHRGKLLKRYPAKPDDEVWRLKNVAKNGPYHNRLTNERIKVVEDLLRQYVRDPTELRKMLGAGMTDSKWEELVDHAMSCAQSGKLYLYSYDDAMMHGVVFDITGQLKGLIANGSYCSADTIPLNQKEHYNTLVRVAYENWDRVKEFGSASCATQNSVPGSFPAGAFQGQQDYSGLSDCHFTGFHNSSPTELPSGSSEMVVEGYDETTVGGSLLNQQNMNFDVPIHNPPMQALDQEEVPGFQNLAPSEACSAPPTFPSCSTSSLNLDDGEILPEKSPLTFPQYDHNDSDLESWLNRLYETPTPDLHPRCKSRAAVVSWLRIKAVFRWGFFVRRKLTSKVCPTIEQLD